MNLNNSTQDNDTFPAWKLHLISVDTQITLYSILLVWSLLGNVLVIAVVYWNQNLRNNMNYLIVNMAVSDLLIPLVAMPWLISRSNFDKFSVDSPLGEALCKLVPFLYRISPFVSSMSLVIIALQRFIAVVYPTRLQILRSCKTKWIVISLSWIVPMALFSPLFYTLRLTNKWGYTMCSYSWSPAFDHWTAETIFTSLQTAMGFVIPLFVIIILYTIIVYKLRKSLNNVMDFIEQETISSRQKRNRRIFSMLITIVVMFTICWCPYQVFILLVYTAHPTFMSVEVSHWFNMSVVFRFLWFLLAAINPCIYFVFLKDFRQGLKSLCCRKTASQNEPIPRRPRTPGGDDNQGPTCTPPHINTTLV